MATPANVEEYLAALSEDRRVALQEMRRTVNGAAPEATELRGYLKKYNLLKSSDAASE